MTLMAVFLAYALIMGVIETLIPLDFIAPGVRLGLANVVVLTAIYLFSWRDVLGIILLKSFIPSMLFGTVFTFLYSLSGSLLSFAVMYALIRLLRGRLSPVGVSVCGAIAHNVGQLLVASCLVSSAAVFAYLPVLLVSGVITGILVGTAVGVTLKYIETHLKLIGKDGGAAFKDK